jgi:PAS domain S-box-containing protein
MLHARQPMFVAWGPELTLLYNDDYTAVLGSKHPQALGQPFEAAWSDIWPQFGPIVHRVMGGEALSFEDLPILMQRNGEPEDTWFSFSYTPLHDEEGRIVGLFCACTETTSKVRSQQALREHKAQLEALVAARTAELDRVWRNSRSILVVIGEDGIFRAVSPAWTDVLGHQPSEVVGRTFLDFVWPEDGALSREALNRAAGEGDLINFENRYRHVDGTPRWISWSTSVEGGLVYGYGRGVTAEKQQAELLRRTEEQLRQAQKMEAIGQLTGGLAHDFNNLLTAISGGLEIINARISQGRTGNLDRYITAAMGAADRAAALTHRLLAFARRQALDPKVTQVNPLVVAMEDLIRRTVGPEIRIETKIEAGVWPVLCDPNQLENALLNLAINARDAMPHGGQLTIATSNTWLEERDARQRGMAAGQYVTVCVIDTGTGMTSDVKARAFDPFFTTKPFGMGTGLGLSMIHGFLQQSGGQVEIVSEPGAGTTICLHLPGYWGEVTNEHPQPEQIGAPRANTGLTILVVDDEPMVRMLVADVPEDLGYAAMEAGDGASGLEILGSTARIDLLISDIGLPGEMNGRQIADAARRLRPELKVLPITGYAKHAFEGEGQLEPGMRVITKPFALDALAHSVQEMIA